jgi:hypothetical protein
VDCCHKAISPPEITPASVSSSPTTTQPITVKCLSLRFISGGLMALWQLPSTYRWRGYWAIGGEWILIVGAIVIASRLMHELQMQALLGGKKKNDKVRSVSQGHYRSGGNRSGVRREVLRQGVRKTAPSTRKAPQNQDCHTA